MFEPRLRSRLTAVLVGLALGGCAYRRAEPIATGPWAEISAETAATPVASPPAPLIWELATVLGRRSTGNISPASRTLIRPLPRPQHPDSRPASSKRNPPPCQEPSELPSGGSVASEAKNTNGGVGSINAASRSSQLLLSGPAVNASRKPTSE